MKNLSLLQCEVERKNAKYFICIILSTHAESISSDLQRGLDRRLRHITRLNTEQNQLVVKVSADN